TAQAYFTGTQYATLADSMGFIVIYPDAPDSGGCWDAGSAFAGVPYGCFAGPDLWNTPCATGTLTKTAQQWRISRIHWTRPKMQIWQGTLDTTLNYHNFGEGIKQWTNVFGYSATPISTQQNSPLSGWTRTTYGSNFQAISAAGVDHNIQVQANDVLAWFGITGNGGTTTTSQPPTTTNPPTGGTQAHWGQCGGIGWTGPTVCASPYSCIVSNAYFSQCL
ncbi:Alpha/Beta hydrolase protein, partial [Infundibulicybe gibba]